MIFGLPNLTSCWRYFLHNKDYFNAKATYESVSQNSTIPELKEAAQQKLHKAKEEEKATSKI